LMPADSNFQKINSQTSPPNQILNNYTLTPNSRAIKISAAITNKVWIKPPPILSENPPSQAIINTTIKMSNKPITFTPLIVIQLNH
jgi:hypothetical protein